MSFTTTPGTHGARQPSGPVYRVLNRVMGFVLGRTGGIGGMEVLVLTTIGRTSGQERTTPVGRFPDDDGSWLIVASAAGAPDNPGWYYNLAAHPDRVTIEVDGRTTAVTARQLHDEERDRAWARITASAPRFADYEDKTDREIPVIRLTPRAGADPST